MDIQMPVMELSMAMWSDAFALEWTVTRQIRLSWRIFK
jgi:hypothetical protein